ncbi:hypothetical protein B0H12DRAFT_702193 [Mycena haematopus]|nr:hypothetical protein B0H12DRAFT_702193 [Mycena haematopus]
MPPYIPSWLRRGGSKLERKVFCTFNVFRPKLTPILQRSSDDGKQVTPSAAMYAIEGGKALAEALENVSDLIPLPFLSSFVNVGIKVLEACKEATTIEENMKDLQGRVYKLILVVVDTVPINKETSLELQDKIKKLQPILDSILEDVAKIKEQRKWLLVFFKDLNKNRVEKCVDRLNEALEQFTVASQLRIEDLLGKMKADYSAFATQLNRVEDTVNMLSQPHNAPHSWKDMPPPHDIFYGREVLVDDIISLLATERTSRVCITGVGGMGKTSVALAVAEKAMVTNMFPKEYVFWVPCVEAKSPDLLRRILYTQLRITAKSYDSLDPLIADLDASKQRRLLLLDNFETPWLSGKDQAEIGSILVRLAKLSHIALLVTMTSGFIPGRIEWQHRALQALDADAARDAFKTKYRDAAGGLELTAGRELDELLAAIGHIPLAITLMAACGGHQGTSPAALLKEWADAGTRMMSGDETRSMDDTIRVSMEHGVVKSNPEALTLLAILSMLPAGTTGRNLGWWAPTLTSPSAAVGTLRTAALIEFKGDGHFETSRIFVRPTVQSYMSHEDRISAEIRHQVHDACYQFVLDHKSMPDDPKFKEDLAALASEQTNIQRLLMDVSISAPRPKAVDALIAFGLYQSWTKPSTVIASLALEVARTVRDDPHVTDLDVAARHVAEAHRCLGKSLFGLDRWDEACPHFEEASDQLKNLPGGADLHCAGESSMELLDTWIYMGTKKLPEGESLAEAARANLSHDESDKYHVACGLLGYCRFLWWSYRLDEASLETLSAAKATFEELECPASTAKCLQLMARTYAYRKEYSKALTLAKDALPKAEQSGDVELICSVSRVIARCLVVLGSYREASAIITQSLSLSQALAPSGIAQSLELLAYSSVAMMDLPGARVAYQAARVQLTKVQSTWTDAKNNVDRCSDNLRRLEGMTKMDQNIFSDLTEPFPMY